MISSSEFEFATRQEVARRYCRVVAAIDDEIFDKNPDSSARYLSPVFEGLRQSCANEGVLCHLHHYPQISYGPDADEIINDVISGSAPVKTHFERAVKVAEAADVVLLDWNLGSGGSHKHAEEILKKLAANVAVRFVFIYTNASPEEVAKQLEITFVGIERLYSPPKAGTKSDSEEEEEIEDQSESTINIEESEEQTLGFRLHNRFFIFVSAKPDSDSESLTSNADNVIKEVFKALTRCFPDHIKWAGLEMTVRMRNLLPRIIAAMPDNTDGALLLQMLYQREDEVAEQVCHAILDDLKAALHEEPLKTVCDETLFQHLSKHMAHLSHEDKSDDIGPIAQSLGSDFVVHRRKAALKNFDEHTEADKELINLFPRWRDADLEALSTLRSQIAPRQISAWFPNKTNKKPIDSCEVIACYIESCVRKDIDKGPLEAAIAWASMCESVMIKISDRKMRPGAILQKLEDDTQAPSWLLCLSGACDCYRNKNGYLVVAGKIRNHNLASEPYQTQTAFDGKELVWDAGNVSKIMENQIQITQADTEDSLASSVLENTVSIAETSESNPTTFLSSEGGGAITVAGSIPPEAKYKIVGYLRYEFGTRLIHRVWSHQTRVGVDTSEFLRQRRGE